MCIRDRVPGGEGLKVVAAGEHLGDAVLPRLIDGKGAAAEEVVLAAVQAIKVLCLCLLYTSRSDSAW